MAAELQADYQYNNVGQLEHLFYNDGSKMVFHYDNNGNVTGQEVVKRVEAESNTIEKRGAWYKETSSNQSGGASVYTNDLNASLTYNFIGEYLLITSVVGPERGKLSVTIDAVEYPDIDLYSAGYSNKEFLVAQNLSRTPHEVKLQVSGIKNALSTDTFVHIDSILYTGKPLERIEAEDSLPIIRKGVWYTETSTNQSGGASIYTNDLGASVTCKFIGESLLISSVVGPERGILKVIIDGIQYPDVDLYSPSYTLRQFTIVQNLQKINHTAVFTVSGNKNIQSSNTFIHLDSILYTGNVLTLQEAESNKISKSGVWYLENSPSQSGGGSVYTNDLGATLTYSFTGSSILLSSIVGPERGKAAIIIDGIVYPDIDLYSESYSLKDFLITQNLSNTAHTLQISVSGRKNTQSSNVFIHVDSFLSNYIK